MDNTVYKGFINDWAGRTLLPITRGELVLDSNGIIALQSDQFLAKDGHPGLVTSAERTLIANLTSAGGALEQVADIYNKLDYLNVLTFNGTAVNYYNTTTSEQTPIKINSDGSVGIAVNTLKNEVTFSLPIVHQNETKVESTIIKKITVDKYGRVTTVSGSDLINADIPNELVEKTLKNCVISDDAISGDSAIVNKKYVDDKFNNISAITTGALIFGGPLSKDSDAISKLSSTYLNYYYRVTSPFDLNKGYFHDSVGVVGDMIYLKAGDTLIVYAMGDVTKFVYIPSADEITAVSVTTNTASTPEYASYAGNVVLEFNDIFNIAARSNVASITLPAASETTGGYLTQDDWKRFNSYSSTLSTMYEGEFNAGAGVYKIGTLTIGGKENFIFGRDSVSSISLENGSANNANNPILKFTTLGKDDVKIAITGVGGIVTTKDSTTLKISANNNIVEQTVPQADARKVKYLTLEEGYKFGVQIGSANTDGTVATDGLTDFSQFNALVNKVKLTTVFDYITYSLSGTTNVNEYRYGNDKLKAAINVTI